MYASTDKFGVEIDREIYVVRLDYQISHRLAYLGRIHADSIYAAYTGLASRCENSRSLIS